jgi:2-polyprenyl-3-methyl-5-hydroxy-6-metoxy-1,4-benzoquinol methylase
LNDGEPTEEIRAILANLQEEIRRHRLALGELGVVQQPDILARARERQLVNPHLPLGWPTMPKGVLAKITTYAQKITRRLLRWYINPLVAQQNEYNVAATDALATLHTHAAELSQQIQAIGETFAQMQRVICDRLEQLQNANDAQMAHWQQIAAIEQETFRLRLQRLENWRRAANDTVIPLPAPSPAAPGALDTFLLGARYRNPAQMHSRLDDYGDVYRALLDAQGQGSVARAPVLEIGCGRGELVAHLAELGLSAYGIDLDADAIQVGQADGRDVRCEDALAHLNELADRSLAGVVMIQVIEHFDVPALNQLLALIARKLIPGGFILAETLNPACLYALVNWYLMDPTHKTPLNSEVTRFLLEQAELWQVQIRFVHPVPKDERLIGPQPGENAPAALARDITQLNQFLYGPQDYAAIAYKPQE